jgi:hypothetical protein
MSLLQKIRDKLSQQKRLSLTALARACDASQEDIIAHLQFYLHKGWVCKKELGKACHTTCAQCDLSALVVYEWVR